MAATAKMLLEDDPRCQPGAYLSYEARLYEARYLKEQKQSAFGGTRVVWLLEVIDCASPLDEPKKRWLNEGQIQQAELVRRAPVLEVEDYPA